LLVIYNACGIKLNKSVHLKDYQDLVVSISLKELEDAKNPIGKLRLPTRLKILMNLCYVSLSWHLTKGMFAFGVRGDVSNVNLVQK